MQLRGFELNYLVRERVEADCHNCLQSSGTNFADDGDDDGGDDYDDDAVVVVVVEDDDERLTLLLLL